MGLILFFFSFFAILGFTYLFTFNCTSQTNETNTTIETDNEKFVDDVNNKYPVNSVNNVYSNNPDIGIDNEESVVEDSDNESEHYCAF